MGRRRATVAAGLLCSSVLACSGDPSGPDPDRPVSFIPLELNDGWVLSTPSAEGLDSAALQVSYDAAAQIPSAFSLLVVRNGALVAEAYFNGESAHRANPIQSATKSFTSALFGIALEQGLLSDLDGRMVDYFPDFITPELDSRKNDITVRQLLQMRAGYPADGEGGLVAQLNADGDWLRFAVEHPLAASPGEQWAYSNLSAILLGGILPQVTGTSTLAFAQEHLFDPLGISVGSWFADPQGIHVGSGGLSLKPRDLARFGLLYLNGGLWEGEQVIPEEWIAESWEDHSPVTWGNLGDFRNCRYGYLWWHAETGGGEMRFAGGQGGQFAVIVPSLNMVVVSTAFGFDGFSHDEAWQSTRTLTEIIDGLVSSIVP